MVKFEVGKTYVSNYGGWAETYEVIARTAATVTVKDQFGYVKKYRVNREKAEFLGCECVGVGIFATLATI